jgi:WD40 repeat protein
VLSPDSRSVAAWDADGLLRVWNTMSGRTLLVLRQPAPVSYAAFSPDSARLAVCVADTGFSKRSARVFDLASRKPVGAPLEHNDGVLFAAFSPSADRVATAGEDYAAIVWQTATGRQLTQPMRHASQVVAAAFNADAKLLLTSSADHTARVWSTATGEPLTPPLRHLSALVDGRFLGDGRQVLTLDNKGVGWLWDLPEDGRPAAELVQIARLLTGDMVTPPGTFTRAKSEPLSTVWQQLQRKYPADFSVSKQEVLAWHRFQAEQNEAQQEWYAVRFHLERLAVLDPSDQSLSNRLAHTRLRLQQSH